LQLQRRYLRLNGFAEISVPSHFTHFKYFHYKKRRYQRSPLKQQKRHRAKTRRLMHSWFTGILATRNPSPASMYSILKFPLKYSLKLRYNAVFFFVEYHNLNFEIRKFINIESKQQNSCYYTKN
jgi:hypothetical protein